MPTAWVVTAMNTLLAEKAHLIDEAYRQKGGWEGWAQVEIAISLAAGVPNSTVQREFQIYTNKPGDKADIVLRIENDEGHQSLEVLELKCWGQLRTVPQFIALVEKDINRIQVGTYGVDDVRPWVMVLVVDGGVKNQIRVAMEAKRRQVGGVFVDQVQEHDYNVPNSSTVIYLLAFIMPINIDVDENTTMTDA